MTEIESIGVELQDFNVRNISKVPKVAGVFHLYTVIGEILYIGAGDDLQEELMKCRQAFNPCLQKAKYYKVEINPDFNQGEINSFIQYKEDHDGKLPRCNRRDPTKKIHFA